MVAIKIEFVSSKFQAFSSYSLICGENCVLCRLSATVYFFIGYGSSFNGKQSESCFSFEFVFLFVSFSHWEKEMYFWYFLYKQKVHNENKVRKKNTNLSFWIFLKKQEGITNNTLSLFVFIFTSIYFWLQIFQIEVDTSA